MAHSNAKMVPLSTYLNPGALILMFVIFFISHVEVASFVLADSFMRSHHRLQSSLRSSSDGLGPSKVKDVTPKAVFTENVMNQRLIELGSKPIDFELLKETIAEWSKPLPRAYLFQPIILVGPSGVGKGKLVKALMKDYKKFFCKIVTHTTRGPRPDEVNGVSYNFVTKETFHEMVQDGKFLEWATVHDNFYGTSIDAFKAGQNCGKISIMEIDVQGARSVKAIAAQYNMQPKYVFIAPPNIEKLQLRLTARGTESPEQIALRLRNAEIELEDSQEAGFFDKKIVNDDLQATVDAFFRLMRDWYPALPSATKLRMLQRRLKGIKQLASAPKPQEEAPTENGQTDNTLKELGSVDSEM